MTLLPSLAIGLVPVLLFLAGLVVMDSYKLVGRRAILLTVAIGCLTAFVALAMNRVAIAQLHVSPLVLKRYLAPAFEETLKAAYLVVLVRGRRVGFLVDAAIHGFALGTGFALVENVYYARLLGGFDPLLWFVRGLGTAIMHGSTTAIVGVIAKDLVDRRSPLAPLAVLPGLALAIAVHSAYNHLFLNPLATTALILLVMPLLLYAVFVRSEHATRHWLGGGFDADVEMLESIRSGEIRHTRIGAYLQSLTTRFPGPVVADMLCMLQIHLELALRAKGILLARASGLEIPVDARVRANLEELRFLERSIGPTGKLALLPILQRSSRDLWQIYMLQESGKA